MTKRPVLLITAFLSCVAAIAWMMTPEMPPAESVEITETRPVPAEASAHEVARSISYGGNGTPEDGAKIVRHANGEIPAQASLPSPVLPLPPTPSVSPRFVATSGTRSSTASPTGAVPGTHIRILPAPVASGAATPSGGPIVQATSSVAVPGIITLEVGPALHDPAVWAEEDELIGAAQESIKDRIADHFSAEVAAAVTDPAAAKKKGLDQAWQDARARANQEYQMFFGADAANRAAMSAARASLSPP